MKKHLTFCLRAAVAAAVGLASVMSQAESLNPEFDKGYLVFTSDDGSYKMKLDGRIMLDTGIVDANENSLKADTEFRRARLAFKTEYDNAWAGEFDIDFSGNETEIKDMWVAYIAIPHTTIKFGNQKPLFSMAETTTSRWYTFMEVPMVVDSFGIGRRIGVSASYWQDRFFIGGSVFGDEVGISNADEDTSEKFGFSTRGVYRPWLKDDAQKFFHIGYNYAKYSPQTGEGDAIKFNSRPESRVVDYKFLDTGKIKNVEDVTTAGIEFAGRIDRWSFQSEYLTTKVKSADDPEYEASGYYAEVSYFLVGSGRNYNLDDGEFGPVLPTGEHGDLELAVRFSTLDLNDAGANVFGGSADNITVGLNWYAHSNVVFRLNYILSDMDEYADGDGDFIGGDEVSTLALRMEYLF